MSLIRLAVLGNLRIWSEGDAAVEHLLCGDRRTALLLYLALGGPALRRRESILALLWPDEPVASARHRLRQLLHVLRSTLGEGVVVRLGDEYVGVDAAHLWCDAVAFREAVAEGAHERALEYYTGPLADGFSLASAPGFDRWLERTRTDLHELAFRSARALAHGAAGAGHLEQAVEWGRRAVRLAPEDEDMLRWLVRATEQAGGRAAALRVYEEYVRFIREEYDLAPSPELAAEIAQLRALRH